MFMQQSTSGRSYPVFHTALKSSVKTSTDTAIPSTAQSTPTSNEVEEQEEIHNSGEKELDTIQFERRCILFHQEKGLIENNWNLVGANIVLKVVFDAEMLCYRIIAQDDNQQNLCNTIITIETELKVFDPFMLLLYQFFLIFFRVF